MAAGRWEDNMPSPSRIAGGAAKTGLHFVLLFGLVNLFADMAHSLTRGALDKKSDKSHFMTYEAG